MEPKELGTKMGKIAAQALDFLYENFAEMPEITDDLKQKTREEREKIFAEFIPLVKQYRTFGEEEAANIGQTMAMTYLSEVDNAGTKIEKIAAVIERFVSEGGDEGFMRDFASLGIMLQFLENSDDEEAQAMRKHVGL